MEQLLAEKKEEVEAFWLLSGGGFNLSLEQEKSRNGVLFVACKNFLW